MLIYSSCQIGYNGMGKDTYYTVVVVVLAAHGLMSAARIATCIQTSSDPVPEESQ